MSKQKIVHLHGITIQAHDGFEIIDARAEYIPDETFKRWCNRVLRKSDTAVSVFLPVSIAPNKRMKTIQKSGANLSLSNEVKPDESVTLGAKEILSICEIITRNQKSLEIEFVMDAPDRSEYIDDYGLFYWSIVMRLTHLKDYCDWLQDKLWLIKPLARASLALDEMVGEIDENLEEIDDSLLDAQGNGSGSLSKWYRDNIIEWMNNSFWDLYNDLESGIEEDIEFIESISTTTASIFSEATDKAMSTIKTLADRIYEA